ncbi:MAG: thioredoxin family protein [Bacteroidia bacterium]|nr:thioredoxin family protein [Bacteroidia bacterium]
MNLKFSSLLLVSFFYLSGINAQSVPASADAVLKAAFVQAASGKKNVFVMFHASWCAWCHKMDTALYDPVCRKLFSDNYIIEHLTVYESEGKEYLENPGALELLTKYKGNDIGTPYWMIFDKDGNLLGDSRMRGGIDFDGVPGDNIGCPAAEDEVNYFVSLLKRTSSLNQEQLEVIRKRFRQNEQ